MSWRYEVPGHKQWLTYFAWFQRKAFGYRYYIGFHALPANNLTIIFSGLVSLKPRPQLYISSGYNLQQQSALFAILSDLTKKLCPRSTAQYFTPSYSVWVQDSELHWTASLPSTARWASYVLCTELCQAGRPSAIFSLTIKQTLCGNLSFVKPNAARLANKMCNYGWYYQRHVIRHATYEVRIDCRLRLNVRMHSRFNFSGT